MHCKTRWWLVVEVNDVRSSSGARILRELQRPVNVGSLSRSIFRSAMVPLYVNPVA